MSKVNTLSALAKSGALSGKRVFIRADLNVPFDDAGRISEDTRIRASVPGIRMALDAGAAVMVTSHLGRPKEGVLTDADSLAKVGQRLSELLGMPVQLVRDWSTASWLSSCRKRNASSRDESPSQPVEPSPPCPLSRPGRGAGVREPYCGRRGINTCRRKTNTC